MMYADCLAAARVDANERDNKVHAEIGLDVRVRLAGAGISNGRSTSGNGNRSTRGNTRGRHWCIARVGIE